MPPVKPMLAKPLPGIPANPAGEAPEFAYEPKWDGFRCIVFRDGDEVVLGSRNVKPLTRYFPELIGPLRASLPERAVVDGEIVVVIDDHLAFDALQQRIHPADSRVQQLAAETPATFIAFDVLAVGARDVRGLRFADRRALLEAMAPAFVDGVRLCPLTTDTATADDWFTRFEGAGLDGLIVKPLDGTYVSDKRVQFKVKHTRTADVVVAGYRVHKDGRGVGSLLVGLHDADGRLHHVGVASSFRADLRASLVEELGPYVLDDPAEHPWSRWVDPEAHTGTLMPGAPSRWSGGRDASWIPLEPRLVAEVRYEAVQHGRFRGVSRFVRWRPDRTPESCRYDQLEQADPVPLTEVLHS